MTNKDIIDQQSLLVRLRRIEGQLRGIQRMLEDGRECEDVVTQVLAARSGLDQVALHLMDYHIERCLSGGSEASSAAFENLLRTLQMWLRLGTLPIAPEDGTNPEAK